MRGSGIGKPTPSPYPEKPTPNPSLKGGGWLLFGLEGVGGVAEVFPAEVLALVTASEGFERLGVDGSLLAFHLGA